MKDIGNCDYCQELTLEYIRKLAVLYGYKHLNSMIAEDGDRFQVICATCEMVVQKGDK